MGKKVIVGLCLLSFSVTTYGQNNFKSNLAAFGRSVFYNKNVYKTKGDLKVQRVFTVSAGFSQENGAQSYDPLIYTIRPNTLPTPLPRKSVRTVQEIQETTPGSGKTITTITISDYPYTTSQTTTSESTVPNASSRTTIQTTWIVPPTVSNSSQALKYTILKEDGDYTYIKLLPRCEITNDTIISYSTNTPATNNPTKDVYRVATKALEPITRYMASSILMGKLTTLPIRFRKQSWDSANVKRFAPEANLNIGYSFGWKIKVGNHPYKNNYFNVIPYGAGVSSQKYFAKYKAMVSGKDSLSVKADEVAITYFSCGLAYEVDKFNFGIFIGKDKMFGKLRDWVYQDKWWFGIGIGYELFK